MTARLLGYLRPHLFLCLPILISALLEIAFYSGLPFSFRYVIDYGLLGHDHRLLFYLVTGMALGAVIVAALGFLRDRLWARLTACVLSELRLAMFDHLQLLSTEFFARTRVGDILARFSTDISGVENAAAGGVAWLVLPAFDVVASAVLLFVLDWRMALISMLVFPATIAGPRFLAPRVAEESYLRKNEEGKLLSLVQENISAQVVIKAFGLADTSRKAFGAGVKVLRQRVLRVGFLSAMVERSAYVGIMLLQVALLGIGAYLVARGSLTVGALAAFQAIFLALSYSMASVTQYLPALVEASGALRRIEELLAQDARIADHGKTAPPASFGEIRFNGVRFLYDDDSPGLDSFTVNLANRQYTAVVGTSGSGKSTLLKLLMRLYDPAEGFVSMDGLDIRGIPLRSLRALYGYVPQESLLFDVSIRENICLGRSTATREEVERAARLAEVHEFILQLPQGYETQVGERGSRLSGGQRQRVALARALVRNPPILILDEVTSALDPATEAAIQATLDRLRGERMIISVTHRLGSAVNADRILVLHQGRLCQDGTHAALVNIEGPYRALWNKQHGFSLDSRHHHAEIALDRLRLVPVFYGIPDALLADAAASFCTEEFPENHAVTNAGEFAGRMFVIVRGSVEILRSDAQGRQKRALVLEDGDYFGERALLEAMPEAESARTITPCVLLSFDRSEYLEVRRRAQD